MINILNYKGSKNMYFHLNKNGPLPLGATQQLSNKIH